MALSEQQLIDYLEQTKTGDEVIAADTELFSTGILDSVAMMNVIMFVEETARVEVHPADVTLDNFDTVSRIVAYCEAQS